MATSAVAAHGTKLYRGSSGTPRTGGQVIEEVFNLDPPEQTAPEIDATSHDSAAAEYILSSCLNNGELTIEMHYVAGTGQELLRGDHGGGPIGYYINTAGGSGQAQLYFTALVKSFKLGTGREDSIKATAVLRITDTLTWTTQS